MPLETYLAFGLAATALILMPGPNVALILANTVGYGTRSGLLTVAGTSSAIFCQLVITVFGVTSLLVILSDAFVWLRWLGIAYLIYLGVTTWRASPSESAMGAAAGGARKVFWQGFVISFTNPKTILFYSAFFPQFIHPEGDVFRQMAILAATFLGFAIVLDSGWAMAAGHARNVLHRWRHLQNRVVGALYLTTAAGLSLVRR